MLMSSKFAMKFLTNSTDEALSLLQGGEVFDVDFTVLLNATTPRERPTLAAEVDALHAEIVVGANPRVEHILPLSAVAEIVPCVVVTIAIPMVYHLLRPLTSHVEVRDPMSSELSSHKRDESITTPVSISPVANLVIAGSPHEARKYPSFWVVMDVVKELFVSIHDALSYARKAKLYHGGALPCK